MLREAWQGRMDSMRQHLADVENTPGLTLLCLLGAATGALCGLVILSLVVIVFGETNTAKLLWTFCHRTLGMESSRKCWGTIQLIHCEPIIHIGKVCGMQPN